MTAIQAIASAAWPMVASRPHYPSVPKITKHRETGAQTNKTATKQQGDRTRLEFDFADVRRIETYVFWR
jgi:uncharacterized protein YxeA